jgi:hypothetical protein
LIDWSVGWYLSWWLWCWGQRWFLERREVCTVWHDLMARDGFINSVLRESFRSYRRNASQAGWTVESVRNGNWPNQKTWEQKHTEQ